MTRARWLPPAVGAVLCASIGLGLGLAAAPKLTHRAIPKTVCRPSSPELLAQASAEPVVLLWGNSLVFDHDWARLEALAVNCARQGLRVRTAVSQVASLPGIDPDLVVLAFGTVEAISASMPPVGSRPEDFRAGIGTVVEALRARWPEARIVLNAVPWRGFHAVDADAARAFNAVMAGKEETTFLALNAAFEGRPPEDLTYDGVHLAEPAYLIWEAALNNLLQ